ncbi:TonB-dependent siderophore receptor [Thauera linaloolentis]|uniref:Tonb-dependent siderophore receptor n=1 Tax=Thauera linaloolentis (strain DSM 12138 / JCM 21573 / CCUG 41526 / CIP 105981 / IAM 15112 / NBRC 102519 / 47Lol) TaxID=1123367 RepID=N6YWG5_THAL4|nr:TonB-dependent siderophore receptor [Thauera linaloolentis]ENO86767.1 tonb-dependent siderophore receptor [Thauera linaloolentis 47Lol = DSM 12138]MCM8567040.1 TonB-dependent siderophore receptor [Thauera linaloolentis]
MSKAPLFPPASHIIHRSTAKGPAPRLTRLALHLACAALLPTLPVGATFAQPAQAGQEAQRHSINIAPGRLSAVLGTYAAQAGVHLSADGALTQGLQSEGLKGRYDIAEGFARLLARHGLQAMPNGDGSYTLATLPRAAGEATLGAVTVTAKAERRNGTTEDTGSYTQTGPSNTATRLGMTLRETPQSVSVVTRQQMDDFGLNEINDVLQQTPGITVVAYDSERTTYYSRGFTIDSFQYDGISTTRDIRYSSGDTLTGTAIYDRVEVLKGASGLMTGRGDPGGTINLIRKRPTSQFSGHATASAGSWDNYRTEIDVGGPLNESGSIRGRAVAAYQDKKSYLDHYERKSKVFYGVLESDLTPDTLLTVGATYQDTIPKGSNWGGTPLFTSDGDFNDTPRSFNPGVRWSSNEQYSRSAFATLEHNFSNGWTAKANFTHQINGYNAPMSSASGGQPNPITGSGAILSLGKFDGEIKQNAVDAYAKGPFALLGREHEVVVGINASHRDWKTKDYFPAYDSAVEDFYNWNGDIAMPDWGTAYPTAETTREIAGYITARFNLRDDLKLTLGSRIADYRGETTTEKGIWVPYAGVVYDLNETFSAYASYTSIFKPQTRQDVQGKTLDPLEGDSYEAGLKAEFFDGRLNGSLAYFDIRQDNYALQTSSRAPSGSWAYEAIKGVKTTGYEFELSGELLPGWQAHAGYTHKSSRRTGKRVSTWEPEDQLSLYTSYKIPTHIAPLTVGGGARWQSKSWNTLSNPIRGGSERFTQKSYWLVDLMLRYQINQNLSASLGVNNVLDKKYFYNNGIYSYIWGEPRSANVSIRYDF